MFRKIFQALWWIGSSLAMVSYFTLALPRIMNPESGVWIFSFPSGPQPHRSLPLPQAGSTVAATYTPVPDDGTKGVITLMRVFADPERPHNGMVVKLPEGWGFRDITYEYHANDELEPVTFRVRHGPRKPGQAPQRWNVYIQEQ